ncbi:permease family protein [Mycobacterium xenopi 3993]|nr:permease family protein [Mycobacterium xenopi 3993]
MAGVHPPKLVCGSGVDRPDDLLIDSVQRAFRIHHQRAAGRNWCRRRIRRWAALAGVVYIGPITTVLVVAGTGATAMCADLGARTIREELDAMRVMGISPVQRLLVPRVLALGLNGLLLNSINTIVGLVGSFSFSVYFQHVTPGAWAAGLTLLVGLPDIVIAFAKAALFGLIAGTIACYKGVTVGGGPQGVGNAVNETVVYTFVALFVINVVLVAVGTKVTM